MSPLLRTALQVFLSLLFAPFAWGLIRFLKSQLSGRSGVSPFVSYAQIIAGFRKENLIPPMSSWAFTGTPYVVLAASVFLVFSLPLMTLGGWASPFSQFLVFIGVLALADTFRIFGAIDAGGVIGGMGASRQMVITALSLPTLVLIFSAYALKAGTTTIDGMLMSGLTPFGQPFLLLVVIAFILIALAENGRYPVDNPETSLELTMIGEALTFSYSGPYLAMLEYAAMIRLLVFMMLLANMIFPFGLLLPNGSFQSILVMILCTLLKISIAAGLTALLESTIAKMRFYRLQEYLASAFFIALAGLALVLVTEQIL